MPGKSREVKEGMTGGKKYPYSALVQSVVDWLPYCLCSGARQSPLWLYIREPLI